eukprot:1248251-Pyramimonas_sp.AAC.1
MATKGMHMAPRQPRKSGSYEGHTYIGLWAVDGTDEATKGSNGPRRAERGATKGDSGATKRMHM